MKVSRLISVLQIVTGLVFVGTGLAATAQIGPFAPSDCPDYVLSVNEYAAETPDGPVVNYEYLTSYQKEHFNQAINGTTIPINRSQWLDEGKSPSLVEYENTIYNVAYYGNECNVFEELYLMVGPILVVLGTILVVFGRSISN